MIEKKIIFMGTPEISSVYLKSLINEKFNIVGVFSQPARRKDRGMTFKVSPVQNLADEQKINVFTPLDLNNNEIKNVLLKIKPDLIIVMGYGLKLPSYILNLPSLGCINIHVSLLPRWRGASPIEHTLLYGDNKAGVTIFKLIDKMDAGPIIVSEEIKIDEKINKYNLTLKLNELGNKLLISTLPEILNGNIELKSQDENQVTYAKKFQQK